jgi:predicted lysophospholipase L1 biosynthesis ABC-type transport system permease subunit
VIYGVLLKPLPYANSDRLVLLRQSAPLIGRDDVSVSIKEFYAYRDTATADFDGLVEFHQMNFDLVVGEGLALVGVGLAVGGVAALAATRVLQTYLFDTTPTDPIAFGGVAMACVVAGVLACLGPAWRATTVNPINALRAE